MEPWLDSLSEDWDSQPRSSPPASLPKNTPDASLRSMAHSPKSRIPRPRFGSKPAEPAAFSSPLEDQSTSLKRRRILAERSSSETNLPRQSSKSQVGGKIPLTSRISRSSSTSSVVRATETGTQQRKSRSSSPTKSSAQSKGQTPEWKRLVMGDGKGNTPKNDLFAPIGLEGIFVKPLNDPAGSSPQNTIDSSLLQGSESIPSSPPPWPSNHLPSHTKAGHPPRWASYQTLEAVVEQDEENQNVSHERSSELDSRLPVPPKSRVDDFRQVSHFKSPSDGSKDFTNNRPSSANQISAGDAISSPSDLAVRSGTAPVEGSVVELSTSDSSVSDGLSPVFISKHHTLDGRVDYAALDISNPDVMIQMKQMSLQNDCGNRSASWQTAIRDATSEVGPITPARRQQPHLDDCARLSGFVSVDRGGHSDDDSFKRRPLSPSIPASDLPSDSLAPSDSASQAGLGGYPDAEHGHVQSNGTKRSTGIQTAAGDNPKTDPVLPMEIGFSSSPLKLFANHDTFTNNQLLRRIGQLDISVLRTITKAKLSQNLKHGVAAMKDMQAREAPGTISTQERDIVEDRATGDVAMHQIDSLDARSNDGVLEDRNTPPPGERDIVHSKRSPPTPIVQTVPKRQRTICRLDEIPVADQGTSIIDERAYQIQSLIGKKRKDARYDDNSETCKPDELAKREILRPRNLTSGQVQVGTYPTDEMPESFTDDGSCADMIEQHPKKMTISAKQGDTHAIQALASEVTDLYLNASTDFNGSVRKQSVSTQDYVLEAMKLMEIIRSTRKPQSELSTFKESNTEGLTPQTISRPPSRDGQALAWRDQNREPLPTQVLQRLNQYRETEEESFTVSSAIRPLNLNSEQSINDEPRDLMESEMHDVRILGPSELEDLAADTVDTRGSDGQNTHQQVKSQSSQASTDSTGRTIQTNSSQKIRNVATIAPDKVSHLIQSEQAGMRFDAEQSKWIRCKGVHTSAKTPEHISSSIGTENDPFEDIPDLDVNGLQDTIHPSSLDAIKHTQLDLGEDYDRPRDQVYNCSDDLSLLEPASGCEPVMDQASDNASPSRFHQAWDEGRDPILQQWENRESNYVSGFETLEDNDKPHPNVWLSKSPSESFQGKRELREHSDSLCSTENPPVLSGSTQLALRNERDRNSSIKQPTRLHRQSRARSVNDPSEYRNGLSLSCIDEHQEISFTQTRPDGRTFSLTLSMSTPITPSDRRLSFAQLSALRSGRSCQPLSPLSDFTLQQDDYSHLEGRNLVGVSNALQLRGHQVNTSLTVSKLVDKLIEAHQGDADWDATKELSLQEKTLDSLLRLEDFCPSIETLDVSRNELRHVDGIPLSIRQLHVRQNLLSGLTNWSHLTNLQYLNISGNELDSLEALSCLIHLRELRADNNAVVDLQGVLDLKGLLHLSLRSNQLRYVSFLGANMSQLLTLDLCENSIEDLDGLSDIPSLEELYLSNNFMKQFPTNNTSTNEARKLRAIYVDDNFLEEMNVSSFPNLRTLVADNNSLVRIKAIAELEHVETVCLRSQKVPPNRVGIGEYLNDFAEVRHLYLSDNRIPSLQMSTSFLNLQTLEMAATGLRSLPASLSTLAPNLRAFNVNFNALSDLRPLKRIQRLKTLLAAGNRIKRLRYTAVAVNKFPELNELDLRGNVFCTGFFPPTPVGLSPDRPLVQTRAPKSDTFVLQEVCYKTLQQVLPSSDPKSDISHIGKLDDNTRQRRKVYELLLATRCESLKVVDGLPFEIQHILMRDSIWDQLTSAGFIEKHSEVAVA